VVVLSGVVEHERAPVAEEALRAGAVDVLPKPRDLGQSEARARLRGVLKAMAKVKVVRRRGGPESLARESASPVRIIAVGSSAGGPPALGQLLAALPADFACTVLIAQHLAEGSGELLRKTLAARCALPVERVHAAAPFQRGRVYLAGEGSHLELDGEWVRARPASPRDSVSPSVDRLFDSLRPVARAVAAVVLTGMGRDGAEGLRRLRQAGAYTLVQDEASALVYGMPGEARGAALCELPLEKIGPHLVELVRQASGGAS
jgi:two-component system chemotaxis response regulator CheB